MKYGSFKYGQYAYGVHEPKITAVTITPNPVNINASFKIAVAATEVEVVMYAASKISGAAKSGESISLTISKEAV